MNRLLELMTPTDLILAQTGENELIKRQITIYLLNDVMAIKLVSLFSPRLLLAFVLYFHLVPAVASNEDDDAI